MNFNNNAAGFTPRRDKLRNEYRDQLKTARAEEERKNKARIQRDHRRIMPSNYVVPSMKRRDQLRWNVGRLITLYGGRQRRMMMHVRSRANPHRP